MNFENDFSTLINVELNEVQLKDLKSFLEEFKIKHNINDYSVLDNLIIDCYNSINYLQYKEKVKEAILKGESTIPKHKWGVHHAHCCLNHGCKYGDEDCPVVLELVKQEYPCELCEI